MNDPQQAEASWGELESNAEKFIFILFTAQKIPATFQKRGKLVVLM
jgi:hypothetical protein